MKFLGLVGIVLISVACNSAAPTATTYKQQLGAPAAATANNNNSTPAAGDAAKGQTALVACTGCHADGGVGHVLVAADADSIGKGRAGSNPVHGSVAQNAKDAFKNNAADMAAFLSGGAPSGAPAAAGDAAKGDALLKAQCESCHNPDPNVAGVGPTLDEFSDLDKTIAAHPAGVVDAIGKNKADLAAALKAP